MNVLFAVISFALGASFSAWYLMRKTRVWIQEIRVEVEALGEAGTKSSRALHALVMRDNGFVDISKEEWETQEWLEMKVIEMDEGGVRILAK